MRDRLERVPVRGADGAEERAWRVIEAAFAERSPAHARHPRALRAALALAVAAAGIAALATPPGRAVVEHVREAVGVERAQPALFSLPSSGRLLVSSDAGAWIVQPDGSRRLLGKYASATWSPHGLYVAATRADELAALEPDGGVRWSLARPAVLFPRWTGTPTDTRIAYFDRTGLRVVAGDGTGDRLIAPAATGPAAWRPGPRRELAYVSAREVRVQDADSGRVVWRAGRGPAEAVNSLSWSTDGSRLLVLAPHALRVYDARGRLVARDDPSDGAVDAAAAFIPGTRRIAVISVHGAQSDVFLLRSGRLLFRGTGVFEGLAPSPDGRWLLVGWPTADQWVFIGTGSRRRIRAVSNVSGQFRSASFPRLEGWCCTK